ncbi:Nif3-like dinuclear metal center hexameric protein [Niabella terrae]
MQISAFVQYLENLAPRNLQEPYDNAGLLTGAADWECKGVLCCLDALESVVDEAMERNCNLIVAHHPILFRGLKSLTGKNYVERTLIKAIKNDIAIYAIHTNLDAVLDGVNGKIAEKLGLTEQRILRPKTGLLNKLYFYVPEAQAASVLEALFEAGGGRIGNYSECSFRVAGTGTFKPLDGAQPFLGAIGQRETAAELKVELLVPEYRSAALIRHLQEVHPYEEVAYELVGLQNEHPQIGSGLSGRLPQPMATGEFLERLREIFGCSVIRHTAIRQEQVERISVCGGAGSFLINDAISCKSDVYVTSDLKYHEFFDADHRLLLVDIGHYESEQFTIELLKDRLAEKFPNFAVLKTGIITNPVRYFV